MSIAKHSSPSALSNVPEDVRRKVSLPETEESWDTIQQGIIQLTEYCNDGGCVLESEIIAEVRSLSRPINNALNSERSRLSGSAIELITALSTGLCRSFESLLPVFIYTLLGLCARANKLFVTRAKACIITIIEYTRSSSILSYLAESVDHKSPSLRLAVAEGVLACLGNFDPSDGARARRFENIIKVITQDARADIRATGKKISAAYKAVLPEGVACSAPVTSVVKKTERIRSVEPSSRQGAPAGPGSRPVRNADQKRDALCPLIPVNSPPELVESMPVRPEGGLRVRGKPQRVFISAVHPPRADNAEKARTIRPPSVKPTPACTLPPKSYIPRYSQKNALTTTKPLPISSKLRTTILPLSKAEHPVSSRVGLLPKKVGVLSHAGVRVVTSGGRPASVKPLVEPFATMRSNLCETKNRNIHKHLLDVKVPPIRAAPQAVSSTAVPLASFLLSTPRPSRHVKSAALLAAQPPASANTQYTVRAPEGAIRPLRAGCRSRKSPFRSRRHNNPCANIRSVDLLVSTPRIKIPRMEFLTSTPRDPSSLPLSPPFFLGAECIRRPPNFAGLRVARY